MVSFISDSQCQCQVLQLTLSNQVQNYHHNLHGIYELYKTVNGKPRYRNRNRIGAIWYKGNQWIIGNLAEIGTGKVGIGSHNHRSTEDCPQQVPNNKWDYWVTSNWRQTTQNDISFQCIDGKKI